MIGKDADCLRPPPGDGAGRGCGGEPGAAGGGFCPSAERHTPAGAAAVPVAGPDPGPDRHPGGHAAAAAAGHAAAGTSTRPSIRRPSSAPPSLNTQRSFKVHRVPLVPEEHTHSHTLPLSPPLSSHLSALQYLFMI